MLFSIVILVYNEDKTIGPLIQTLLQNISRLKKNSEIVVVDSQSTDHTAHIVKSLESKNKGIIRYYLINKTNFNYGLIRNWSVKKAHGKYIFFISGDSVLCDRNILNRFSKDFLINRKIVAVFGKQNPYPSHSLLTHAEYYCRYTAFEKYFNLEKKVIQRPLDKYKYLFNNELFYLFFISNSFACYKKSFIFKHLFEGTKRSEDILMGKMILDRGYYKIYDSLCELTHSHDKALIKRFVDIYHELNLTSKLKVSRRSNFFCHLLYIIKAKDSLYKKMNNIITLIIFLIIKILFLIYFETKWFAFNKEKN